VPAGIRRVLYVNKDITTHIITGEPIKLVDISTPLVVGNTPTDNLIRLKPKSEFKNGDQVAMITIVTDSYLAQYNLQYVDNPEHAISEFVVLEEEKTSHIPPGQMMNQQQMYEYAWTIFTKGKSFYDVSSKKHRMKITLNNIYTVGNLFFIDISLENKSNILYEVDQIRFKIEDKKQTKATSFQSIEIEPQMNLLNKTSFLKHYRNVFVFKKFTFPNEKMLSIEFSEGQISGRVITLRINYSDILHADAFDKHLYL